MNLSKANIHLFQDCWRYYALPALVPHVTGFHVVLPEPGRRAGSLGGGVWLSVLSSYIQGTSSSSCLRYRRRASQLQVGLILLFPPQRRDISLRQLIKKQKGAR